MREFEYKYELDSKERREYVESYVREYGEDSIPLNQLVKMYDYIINKMDKEDNIKIAKNSEGKAHIKVLINKENGIKTTVTNVKRHTPKYACTCEKSTNDNMNRVNGQSDTIKIINDSIDCYRELKLSIKGNEATVRERLSRDKIITTPYQILMSINADIADCKEGLTINKIMVKQFNFGNSDSMKHINIDYKDNKFVRTCLRSLDLLYKEFIKNPDSTMGCVYSDIINAIAKCEFTMVQKRIVKDLLIYGDFKDSGSSNGNNNLNHIVAKVIKQLEPR